MASGLKNDLEACGPALATFRISLNRISKVGKAGPGRSLPTSTGRGLTYSTGFIPSNSEHLIGYMHSDIVF
jgi:hypothetical protein